MDHKIIVRLLLEAGSQVDVLNVSETIGEKGDTALHCAAFWGRDDIAKFLLAGGADVNAKSATGRTPLHNAALMGNVRIARLLLENGAKIDSKDNDGKTPLDCCEEQKSTGADEIQNLFSDHRSK